MSDEERPVLVSWVAHNHDPFVRNRARERVTDEHGEWIPGPTLNMLFHETSPYRGKLRDVALLYRDRCPSPSGDVFKETKAAVRERDSTVKVKGFPTSDIRSPTDHVAIHNFVRLTMPSLRRTYGERTLLINVSPGTPAMQTIWVLLQQTGQLDDGSVRMVQSHSKGPRFFVEDVNLDIESIFRVFKGSRPATRAASDGPSAWDPSKFRSEALRNVYAEARRAARVRVPLLILGERGTGKTTLAGWVRANSPFRRRELDDNWPALVCGQYTPDLMRSELFGYKAGSHSTAQKNHDGVLKRADGDTVFLDEIGDISTDLQRLLIKAIEEGTYTPLGGRQTESSSFRLIAATNQPWAALTERLHPDFLDRIRYLTVRLPPLREVREELDWLWDEAFARACRRASVPTTGLSDSGRATVIEALRAHPLPGNIRDLYVVAYRAIAALGGDDAMNEDAAIEYALRGLTTAAGALAAPSSSDDLMFARAQRLRSAIASGEALDLPGFRGEFAAFLADEVLGSVSGLSDDEFKARFGMTRRGLQKWRQPD